MNRIVFVGSTLAALVFGACGGTSVGQSCETNDNCDNGQTCFIDPTHPGGYCSKGCTIEGSVSECPGGSICAMHTGQLLCSRNCDGADDCRSGYQCIDVEGTSLKACRPG